ncbi:DUF599 domain-containing protein [Labrys wisconsinensis]|uniref:Membrane protein n=1 Tax=Labrys wisconsinensis TaxID=425677 RepID=A0ABU0JH39_9HYPH|nr:DUF599 family protein [Labrys wisconsinensis]MDQ0472905.1 putative membrane protein [Labrys wisconsinensis]
MLNVFKTADLVAAGWFAAVWILYGLALEHPRLARHSLNGRMDAFRRRWMQRMIEREVRILDSTVMASLQNGTAFFASTALIALGGSLSLLRSSDEAVAIFSTLPLSVETVREAWEMKVIGLSIIFAYAFFKFAWAYRVMNYVAILIAATPNSTDGSDPEAQAMAARAAAMNMAGGGHFNRGQRAFFLALGYLGWFVSPYVFMVSTTAVLAIMVRRQFASAALRALDASKD